MFFTTTQRHDASRHVKGGIEATVARANLPASSPFGLSGRRFHPAPPGPGHDRSQSGALAVQNRRELLRSVGLLYSLSRLSWLTESCWNNPSIADPPRKQLMSDLRFVTSQHIGSLQRVWISLDQLMLWNSGRGFDGWQPGALQRVDDMLAIYHQYHVQVILVLFVFDGSSGWQNHSPPGKPWTGSMLR